MGDNERGSYRSQFLEGLVCAYSHYLHKLSILRSEITRRGKFIGRRLHEIRSGSTSGNESTLNINNF